MNVCEASYAYEYDHLAGVSETTIRPTYIFGPLCTGAPTYSCNDNSNKKPNLCTANDDKIVLFDTATGELKMLSNSPGDLDAGTYDIVLGVTNDGVTATCTTQVIVTDPCQDPSATFTLNDPPSPAFSDQIYTLGDPEMDIMSWTWPQIFIQSVPAPVICHVSL